MPDPVKVIEQCERARVLALAVTTTPNAWRQNVKWTRDSEYVHSAVGLHPELAAKRASELPLLLELMKETPFVGEVGLDGSREHRATLSEQRRVFRDVLRTAESLGRKVLSIHSRQAAREVVELLDELTTTKRVLAIFHWASGSGQEVASAIRAGCLFSINQEMMLSRSGRELVASLPEDRLLTETDAPFSQSGDRLSQPVDVIDTVNVIAGVRGESPEAIKAATEKNAVRVFAFAGLT